MHKRSLRQQKCVYCGVPQADLPKSKRSVDHLVPLSRGGMDVKANRVAACLKCNNRKGAMTHTEYHKYSKHPMFKEMQFVASCIAHPRQAAQNADRLVAIKEKLFGIGRSDQVE